MAPARQNSEGARCSREKHAQTYCEVQIGEREQLRRAAGADDAANETAGSAREQQDSYNAFGRLADFRYQRERVLKFCLQTVALKRVHDTRRMLVHGAQHNSFRLVVFDFVICSKRLLIAIAATPCPAFAKSMTALHEFDQGEGYVHRYGGGSNVCLGGRKQKCNPYRREGKLSGCKHDGVSPAKRHFLSSGIG